MFGGSQNISGSAPVSVGGSLLGSKLKTFSLPIIWVGGGGGWWVVGVGVGGGGWGWGFTPTTSFVSSQRDGMHMILSQNVCV